MATKRTAKSSATAKRVKRSAKPSAILQSLTSDQLKSVLTPAAYRAFGKWMYGQTCALSVTGEVIYYAWDIERFIGQCLVEQTLVTGQGANWD